jgi:hypothetical protein
VKEKYPCPCCGYLTHDEGPGDFEFCPVCGWQDDLSQLRFPAMGGGANERSLIDAQRIFLSTTLPDEPGRYSRDPQWRPLDSDSDRIEAPEPGLDYGATYADDRTVYYYWRKPLAE